jgi:hypothetical protein
LSTADYDMLTGVSPLDSDLTVQHSFNPAALDNFDVDSPAASAIRRSTMFTAPARSGRRTASPTFAERSTHAVSASADDSRRDSTADGASSTSGFASNVEADALRDRRLLRTMKVGGGYRPAPSTIPRSERTVVMEQRSSSPTATFYAGDSAFKTTQDSRAASQYGRPTTVRGGVAPSESDALGGTTRSIGTLRSALKAVQTMKVAKLKKTETVRHMGGNSDSSVDEVIDVPSEPSHRRNPKGDGLLSAERLANHQEFQRQTLEAAEEKIVRRKLRKYERDLEREETKNAGSTSMAGASVSGGGVGHSRGALHELPVDDPRRDVDVFMMSSNEATLLAPLSQRARFYSNHGDADIYSRRVERVMKLRGLGPTPRSPTSPPQQQHASVSQLLPTNAPLAGSGPMQRALAALNDANLSGDLDALLSTGWRQSKASVPQLPQRSTASLPAVTVDPLTAPTRRPLSKQEQKMVTKVRRTASAMSAVQRNDWVLAAKAQLTALPHGPERVKATPLLSTAGTRDKRRVQLDRFARSMSFH